MPSRGLCPLPRPGSVPRRPPPGSGAPKSPPSGMRQLGLHPGAAQGSGRLRGPRWTATRESCPATPRPHDVPLSPLSVPSPGGRRHTRVHGLASRTGRDSSSAEPQGGRPWVGTRCPPAGPGRGGADFCSGTDGPPALQPPRPLPAAPPPPLRYLLTCLSLFLSVPLPVCSVEDVANL